MRELAVYAEERQACEWDHTAALMAWISNKWLGTQLVPESLNPVTIARKRRLAGDQKQARLPADVQNKLAWTLLERALKG